MEDKKKVVEEKPKKASAQVEAKPAEDRDPMEDNLEWQQTQKSLKEMQASNKKN